MFTGIIQALGRVKQQNPSGAGRRFVIEADAIAGFRLAEGDSVAVNGVCLTALEPTSTTFAADVSNETLSLTTLDRLDAGSPVNLEPALRAGDPLGGHLVSGHVDGLATLVRTEADGDNRVMRFEAPPTLSRYIAHKGSVTLDGVSLTVNKVSDDTFELNLIPHTLAVTTLGRLEVGDPVNLEVDQLARYMERLLETRRPEPGTS